jgi:hypothetical protein
MWAARCVRADGARRATAGAATRGASTFAPPPRDTRKKRTVPLAGPPVVAGRAKVAAADAIASATNPRRHTGKVWKDDGSPSDPEMRSWLLRAMRGQPSESQPADACFALAARDDVPLTPQSRCFATHSTAAANTSTSGHVC